ncbi:hypothetical protein TrLO_g3621 [Triparma laevis f. longispina]|uniref:Domain of unknown function at the cortex 1 domain-containing protein n=1 Tax=Triparma laevis f. longispina TaxID=1714387 RepID=A0A9W7C6I9_9STRA|nr:hypothetical protein TrLO_g3621 [Triparma laevis f. longispina]
MSFTLAWIGILDELDALRSHHTQPKEISIPVVSRPSKNQLFVNVSKSAKKQEPTPLAFTSSTASGKVLFSSRHHAPPSPFTSSIFSGPSNTSCEAELRLTCKFHRKPSNLTIAAELIDCSQVSWSRTTTFLSHILLKLLAIYSPNMSWSTGDPSKNIKPHISFPLYACVDDLNSGENIFNVDEGEEEKVLRKRDYKKNVEFRKGDTMTFRSRLFYVDFVNWRAKGLPVIDQIPLSKWWGKAGLRLAIYDVNEEGERTNVLDLDVFNEDYNEPRQK